MYKRRGGINFLPRGASKNTPPPPSPEKGLSVTNERMGGGVFFYLYLELIISYDASARITCVHDKGGLRGVEPCPVPSYHWVHRSSEGLTRILRRCVVVGCIRGQILYPPHP